MARDSIFGIPLSSYVKLRSNIHGRASIPIAPYLNNLYERNLKIMQVWQNAKRLKHPIFATRNLMLEKIFNKTLVSSCRILSASSALCYNLVLLL
jgi:hypothetical protein